MPGMFTLTDNPIIFALLLVLNVPFYAAIGRRVFGPSTRAGSDQPNVLTNGI